MLYDLLLSLGLLRKIQKGKQGNRGNGEKEKAINECYFIRIEC
jgi:hypothetical protein